MRHIPIVVVFVALFPAVLMTACLERGRPFTPVEEDTDAVNTPDTFTDGKAHEDVELTADDLIVPEDIEPEFVDSIVGDELSDLVPDDLIDITYDYLSEMNPEIDASDVIADEMSDQDICVPDCDGMECGADGCIGICGECSDGLECTGDTCIEGQCVFPIVSGYCVIEAECYGDGDYPVDNECIFCNSALFKQDWTEVDDDTECGEEGVCYIGECCQPDCEGWNCGSDGCGGSCGTCTDPLEICFVGSCLCVPDCEDKLCGDGGCGTLCGVCTNPQSECVDHQCICTPDCNGLSCGSDGCGGSCGNCDDQLICTTDSCVIGVCSHAVQDFYCFFNDICIPASTVADDNVCKVCQPTENKAQWSSLPVGSPCGEDAICFDGSCCERGANCSGKQCGEDGCGGFCGACFGLDECQAGLCVCVPQCDMTECGADGCGGLCGECSGGTICTDGLCKCKPEDYTQCCGDDVCWFDSCGNEGDITVACDFGCLDGECANCEPQCAVNVCGPDGCGGSCGSCAGFLEACVEGQCVCLPDCEGKECGPNGCGGICGTCDGLQEACLSGSCQCQPVCGGMDCGSDGCGGSCGICLGSQDQCTAGVCLCQSACSGKSCGPDGCGGSCGACDSELDCISDSCVDGVCTAEQIAGSCLIDGNCEEEGTVNLANSCQVCDSEASLDSWTDRLDGISCGAESVCFVGDCCNVTANCAGKDCGSNSCGGSCGTCPGLQEICIAGNCNCVPECGGKQCGPDGCGGLCGTCSMGKVCEGNLCVCVLEHHTDCCGSDACWVDSCGVMGELASNCTYGCTNGACNNCEPECDGKECGQDGCGGFCGTCSGPQDVCVAGNCECQPACSGLECGADGCGDVCGTCLGIQDMCVNGACVCQPACADKLCGEDGCGGHCGICVGSQEICQEGHCICVPECTDKECGADGCGGSCGSCADDLSCTQENCVDGTCVYPLKELRCLIDDFCYMSGATSTDNDCLICNPLDDPYDWTVKPDGEGCSGSGGICLSGECCPKLLNCAGKDCGTDGCGGSCGTCSSGYFCIEQLCVDPTVCDDGNQINWDGCTSGYVSEYLTNSSVAHNQMMPVVAVLEDDAYVIVWQDDKKDDDDSWGIFGQRFSASGQSEGSEFRLNSYSEEDEYDPDVAALSNGGFVAVWYASEFDDNDKVIVGQRFNAAGKQVGKDTMLNQYITGTQENPAVAGLQNGGFVAVWNGAGQSDSQGAYMRLFSASGNALGDDIRVNAVIDGQQDNADVVQLAGGDIIVTWASKDQDGSGYGIYARLFSDDGTPQDSEFQVNTYWHSNQLGPRVAALTAGGFVVSWYGEDSNDSDGVFARRYDVIGTPDGDQFVVNSTLPQKQHFPCLGTLPDDAFLAAWQSDQQDGDSWGIYHRRFDTADNPFAGDAKANFQGSKKQEFPDCAGFSDGTFVIVWQSENQDGDGRGIFHQRFAAEGYRLYP